MERSIESLSSGEQEWLQHQLRQASALVGKYAPKYAKDPLSLKALDAAFAAYIASATGDWSQANDVVLAIGVGFGNQLVEQLAFQWVVSTDQWGTGLAVLARPGRGDVTIFPMDFVTKRFETRETHFLEPSLGAIKKSLKDVAKQWEE
jgi:hypothetical protein